MTSPKLSVKVWRDERAKSEGERWAVTLKHGATVVVNRFRTRKEAQTNARLWREAFKSHK